jgi:hypothetical protein
MKKTFRIIVTLLLLGGWSLAAGALHVVWTGSNVIIIPKNRLALRETYVNITGWTAADVANHPVVAMRLIETGKAESLSHIYNATGEELLKQVQESITHGPTTQPSPALMERVKQVTEQASQLVQH